MFKNLKIGPKLIIGSLAVALLVGAVGYVGYLGVSQKWKEIPPPSEVPAVKKYSGKKIIFIDSYHEGYEWSDDTVKGLLSILENTGVELKIHRMDTKREPSEESKVQAGIKAKSAIEEFKPNVVITSDDNAFKYLIMPYFKDADLPVVFCGINWDVSVYKDAPYKNTTGIEEIASIDQLVEILKKYSRGNRIGLVAADNETQRKEGEYYKKLFNFVIDERYVKSLGDWKKAFLDLQGKVDILIVGNPVGIKDWPTKEQEPEVIITFMIENTKVPTGTIYEWATQYTMVGLTKIPEEHGEWAGQAALKILDGISPSDIPVTQSKKGKIMLNLKVADQLGVVFEPYLLKAAEIVK